MNYVALLVWSLICLVVILLIFMPFASAFDYYKSFSTISGWYDQPLICIINPQPEWKYYALHGVDIWERAFHQIDVYDYDYRIAIGEQKGCTVRIVFGTSNEVFRMTGTSELAATGCYETMTIIKDDVVLRNGTRMCNIMINPDYEAGRYLHQSIVHETGHALGLGHRLPFETTDFMYVHQTKDIMNTHVQLTSIITEESLEALQFFYNYNGWNGQHTGNYTIPH